MTHVLDACAAASVPVIVLDRPNPIGGDMGAAEGPLLDDAYHSLLGPASFSFVPLARSRRIALPSGSMYCSRLSPCQMAERWPRL